MGETDFPNKREQHRRQRSDQTKRRQDARQFLADEVEFPYAMHRVDGTRPGSLKRTQYTRPTLVCLGVLGYIAPVHSGPFEARFWPPRGCCLVEHTPLEILSTP